MSLLGSKHCTTCFYRDNIHLVPTLTNIYIIDKSMLYKTITAKHLSGLQQTYPMRFRRLILVTYIRLIIVLSAKYAHLYFVKCKFISCTRSALRKSFLPI
jgi:hypothetical protein